MADDYSFDVVSKLNLQEVENAVAQRFWGRDGLAITKLSQHGQTVYIHAVRASA